MKQIMKMCLIVVLTLATGTIKAQTREETKTLKEWKAGSMVSDAAVKAAGLDFCFRAGAISDKVFERMKGKSYKNSCPIPREELRYVRALHYDADGNIHLGEMVCNKAIAQDLVEIFRQLYDACYPIERMVLIDEYDADDEQSMSDNNSSCFCYRSIGNGKKLSKHARGMAVDLNTLYNPYYKDRKDGSRYVQPEKGRRYCDRRKSFPYKISKGDLCYRLFIAHGFTWGGNWKSCKDFQHFEK